MCQQASEVQKLHNTKPYIDDIRCYLHYGENTSLQVSGKPLGEGIVWLPRQDQLQHMIAKEEKKEAGTTLSATTQIALVAHWLFGDKPPKVIADITFEQIWLMWYMKEIHNKSWNYLDENWELM